MKASFVVLVLVTIPLIVMVVGVIDSDKLALCHYLKRMKIRGKIYVHS